MSEATITVREATLRLLRELGITTIFGNPGSTELPLFRDFPDDFRYVLALQEAVAIGMADGYAQASRNAAFANLHSSAGTGNALGNLFTAFRNQTPLIVTAGQQARSILPFEPFLFAERATEFPRPFVKWACEPARAQDVPQAIARAYFEAMTPPCGPAFVSIPVDDWDAPCAPLPARRVATANPGDPAAVERLAAELGRARRPAFVLGTGSARDRAWSATVTLAERTGAAVFVAPYAARNVFPENHPLFAGFLPAFREPLVERLAGHDFIVAFGGPLNLYHAEGFGPHLPNGATLWTVADNPGTLALAPQGSAILANTRAVAERLIAAIGPGATAGAEPLRGPPRAADRSAFDDAQVFSRLAALLPPQTIVVEEAPSSRAAMQEHLRLSRPDTFYTTGSGGLGYALPAAVGIALARPDARVVAVVGDGSAMYSFQALYTAHRLRCPVTFVVVNNTSYRALQQFGGSFGMNDVPGTDLADLDFVALARGQGVTAERATDADTFDRCLADALEAEGPRLVEARIQ